MTKKKVLILIGDVGNGHRSAANALTASFSNLYPNDIDIKTIDLFKESKLWPYNNTNEMYKNVSKSKSLETINNAAFKFSNQKYVFDVFTNYTFTQFYDTIRDILKTETPDLVISIHPIVSMVLERLKDERPNDFLSVVVVTDLITLYRGWGDSSADLIFSPTTEAVNTLASYGVNKNRIIYPLFPINPKLKNFKSKEEVFKEFNFDTSKTTILLTGGGVGAKSLNKSIEKLSKHNEFQLIIIAGKLDEYRVYLEEKYAKNTNIKVLGYVDNIQDYLNASDIIIGKPGPATILEIELFDKKAILTRKIGEQEIGNIDYALRNPKFRYISDNWDRLEDTINELANMKPAVSGAYQRRSFDESDMIVKEIFKLLSSEKILTTKTQNGKTLERFLATTVAVSAIGFGVYKLIRKVSKK